MNKNVVLGGLLVMLGLLGAPGQNDAFACTTTAGCHSWLLLEDDRMRRDGRMDEAMKAGRENVEAFRAMQAGQQKGTTLQQGSARK